MDLDMDLELMPGDEGTRISGKGRAAVRGQGAFRPDGIRTRMPITYAHFMEQGGT